MTEVPELSKSKMHNIEVVIDRLVNKYGIRSRLFDSIEAALRLGDGYVVIDTMDGNELLFLSIILVLSVDLRFLNWSQDSSPLMRRSALVRPVMG